MKIQDIHTLKISTPDGVIFSLPLAGAVSRALSLTVDLFVIMAFVYMVSMVVQIFSLVLSDVSFGMMILIQFGSQVLYGILFESLWGGRTIGKNMFGLRVVDERGLNLKVTQVVIRNLMRPVDAMPFFYFVGGVTAFFTPRAQRLGDLVAGTVVVTTRQPKAVSLKQDHGKYNSFRDHPAMEARLRQRTDPGEAKVLALALARRDALDSSARLEVYAELAERFRAKVRFPEECIRGLTDEQYLRNVAASLFQSHRSKGT